MFACPTRIPKPGIAVLGDFGEVGLLGRAVQHILQVLGTLQVHKATRFGSETAGTFFGEASRHV